MLRLVQSREELEADEPRRAIVIIQMQSSNNNGLGREQIGYCENYLDSGYILGNVNRISLPTKCGDEVKNGVKEEFKCLD